MFLNHHHHQVINSELKSLTVSGSDSIVFVYNAKFQLFEGKRRRFLRPNTEDISALQASSNFRSFLRYI